MLYKFINLYVCICIYMYVEAEFAFQSHKSASRGKNMPSRATNKAECDRALNQTPRGRICLPEPSICFPEAESASRSHKCASWRQNLPYEYAYRRKNLPHRASNLLPRGKIYLPTPRICFPESKCDFQHPEFASQRQNLIYRDMHETTKGRI